MQVCRVMRVSCPHFSDDDGITRVQKKTNGDTSRHTEVTRDRENHDVPEGGEEAE